MRDRTPSLEVIQKIVEIFHISAHWLLTGEGPMFPEAKAEADSEETRAKLDALEAENRELKARLEALETERKTEILGLKEEIHDLKVQLAEARDMKLRTDTSGAPESSAETTKTMSLAMTEMVLLNRDLRELNRENRELRARIDELTKQLARVAAVEAGRAHDDPVIEPEAGASPHGQKSSTSQQA